MLNVTYWYYAVLIYKGAVERREGPFDSEHALVESLKHEELIGDFDIVKTVSLYPA
jgi:hypothetical protein